MSFLALKFNALIKAFVFHAILISAKSHALTRLGHLNVNKEFITLSGFSGGGTFAQQLYVSYSSLFSGIAVFSHSFYRCGPGNGVLRDYDQVCTSTGNLRNNELYSPNNALVDIDNYYRSGLIDDPNHMKNKPLYVFAGTRNYLFTADMSLRILNVFEPFINNPYTIKTSVAAANLTLPSDRPDLPACGGPTNSILVSNCGFSGAHDALEFLLGPDAVKPPHDSIKLQRLITFDQTEFFYGTDRNDMDRVGFIYVPTVCQSNKVECLLHFYFHGCNTGREFVGANHILNSGFLEVAEANGIIMVFPQAVASTENNIGCFDTFGVTGPLYATQKGAQVIVLKNMLDRILKTELSSNSPRNHGFHPVSRSRYSNDINSGGPLTQFTASGPSSLADVELSYSPRHTPLPPPQFTSAGPGNYPTSPVVFRSNVKCSHPRYQSSPLGSPLCLPEPLK